MFEHTTGLNGVSRRGRLGGVRRNLPAAKGLPTAGPSTSKGFFLGMRTFMPLYMLHTSGVGVESANRNAEM